MGIVLLVIVVNSADAKGLLKKLKKLKHGPEKFPGVLPGLFPFVALNFGGKEKKDNVHETVREVEVVHEKPVVHTVVKEVPVNIIREEPFERIVHVNRPVDVVKTVPIERINYVDRPYEVIKEVPVEQVVRKRVEVPREVQVPVPVEVPVPRLVHVPVEVEKITTVDRPVEVVKHVHEHVVPAPLPVPGHPKLPKPEVTVGLGLFPGFPGLPGFGKKHGKKFLKKFH